MPADHFRPEIDDRSRCGAWVFLLQANTHKKKKKKANRRAMMTKQNGDRPKQMAEYLHSRSQSATYKHPTQRPAIVSFV
jgi:predicted RNA-binding protein YlxR (DUF448 family)